MDVAAADGAAETRPGAAGDDVGARSDEKKPAASELASSSSSSPAAEAENVPNDRETQSRDDTQQQGESYLSLCH